MICGINDTIFNLLLSLPEAGCTSLPVADLQFLPVPWWGLASWLVLASWVYAALGAETSFHQSSCLCLLCWEWPVSDKVCSFWLALGKRRRWSTSHSPRAPCQPVADVLWVGKQVCSHRWLRVARAVQLGWLMKSGLISYSFFYQWTFFPLHCLLKSVSDPEVYFFSFLTDW